MEKSRTYKTSLVSRLRKGLAAGAVIAAAGVFAFGGTALADRDHHHGDHGEHRGWDRGDRGDWHGDRDDWRGRGYGYGYNGPDYYYAPGPDYYNRPDPYTYYPPEPDYYPAPPNGIERFFGVL